MLLVHLAADSLSEERLAIEQRPPLSDGSRDVTVGRPAEVEAILADLARRGTQLGITTPLLDLATMQLRVYNNRIGSARP